MKIVMVDNWARESVADVMIADNVNEYYGKKIVNSLNENCDKGGDDFFRLEEDDYVLWRGMNELV